MNEQVQSLRDAAQRSDAALQAAQRRIVELEESLQRSWALTLQAQQVASEQMRLQAQHHEQLVQERERTRALQTKLHEIQTQFETQQGQLANWAGAHAQAKSEASELRARLEKVDRINQELGAAFQDKCLQIEQTNRTYQKLLDSESEQRSQLQAALHANAELRAAYEKICPPEEEADPLLKLMKEVVKGMDWLAGLLEPLGQDVSGMKLPSQNPEDLLEAARRETLIVRRKFFYRASPLSSASWVHVDRLLDPKSEAQLLEEQTRAYERLRRRIFEETELARTR